MNTRRHLMWTLSLALLSSGVTLSAQEPTDPTSDKDKATAAATPTATPKTATTTSSIASKPSA
ncbi:MAG: hypothetical protein QGG09_21620, partial [Pirellulaceae bacterium]|nr:hypothetical protein [Pirellulaceae bacterium]